MHIAAHRSSARLALPVVLVAAAVAGGCGAGTHPPVAPSPAAAQPTLTSSALGQAAVAQPQAVAPVIAAGPLVRMFTGARSQAIGSLSEKRSLVIRWTVAKPPIQIYTSKGTCCSAVTGEAERSG